MLIQISPYKHPRTQAHTRGKGPGVTWQVSHICVLCKWLHSLQDAFKFRRQAAVFDG